MNERRNVPEIVIGIPANCSADPKLGSISSLQCQKSRRRVRLGRRMRSDVFADGILFQVDSRRPTVSPSSLFRASLGHASLFLLRGSATRSPKGEAWWSQTGSNRRPHACKARALPAELWPRTRRRMLTLVMRRDALDQSGGPGKT